MTAMKHHLLLMAALAGVATAQYGADISFPMHHENVSTNFEWLPHNVDPSNNPTPPQFQNQPLQPLGDKDTWYKGYLQGCVDHYGDKGQRCVNNERERVEMSLRQPQSMKNYTELGFTKIRAPDHVMELIRNFWELNKDKGKPENWPAGNTYTNHWEAPSRMVSVEDRTLKGGGFVLKQNIWNAARDTIQEWTGQQLAECSLYGIRIYPEGAVLATHVDRLPLVASAIINVDQDVDEPWPLEVIGHDGKAHNVTMVPGDLVLYESHSILHGRPFPLKGRFMANVFIHFEPIGPVDGEIDYDTTNDLPPYVIPGSLEESNWRSRNPNGHKVMKSASYAKGSTEAHRAAIVGHMRDLKLYVDAHEDSVNARDENGWTPLHEAVRTGKPELVEFLLERGSDVNARTDSNGNGGSVLHWAHQTHGETHEVIDLLNKYGAKLIKPGVKHHEDQKEHAEL